MHTTSLISSCASKAVHTTSFIPSCLTYPYLLLDICMQLSYGLITAEQAKRLTLVPFDLEEPSTYKKALAGVGKVVCAVS